jgi:hypothetical protein
MQGIEGGVPGFGEGGHAWYCIAGAMFCNLQSRASLLKRSRFFA